MNGCECLQFERKGIISIDQPTQPTAVQHPRVIVPLSGSAAPCKNRKATNSVPGQIEPKKKVFQQKHVFQKSKESMWGNKNKYAYQPKTYAPRQSLTSCFVLKNNSSGKVVAKYIGKETNIYRNTFVSVPKILVTNMQGPKLIWGPKSSN